MSHVGRKQRSEQFLCIFYSIVMEGGRVLDPTESQSEALAELSLGKYPKACGHVDPNFRRLDAALTPALKNVLICLVRLDHRANGSRGGGSRLPMLDQEFEPIILGLGVKM